MGTMSRRPATRTHRAALVFVAFATVALQGGVEAADDAVEAAAIVDRALERAAAQRESGIELDFEYISAGVFEFLERDGNVSRTETGRRRHYALEGYLYSEAIERDGKPLDEDDARDERERKAEFIREARRHAVRGERYEPEEMSVDFDRELMERYDVRVVGTEEVRGHACWVIAFEPREGRLPDRRRMDKALNRSTGRIWIAQDDYGVARVDFHDATSFPLAVGTGRHAAIRLRPVRLPAARAEPVDAGGFSHRVRRSRAFRHQVDTGAASGPNGWSTGRLTNRPLCTDLWGKT